ncbi:MAG: carboxypeptidase regulatory-like domain-containing protein, partial [Ginsengibacter sp.]
MNKYIFTFLSFTFSIIAVNAQTLKGILYDANEKLPIAGATVKLTDTANTPLTVITNKLGVFNFENLSAGTYTLSISSVGYDPYEKVVPVNSGNNDLGIISVLKNAKVLTTVTINTTAPPVKQKVDTLEYSANAFKVNPDANAEDLLKKMPGVTVDKGTVTAQGETVKKVTIDGREFFGDDATAALRNMPSEVIDKIQVFDRLSDQAAFTGFDDGSSAKSINIVTKANMRNGQFGRAYAGYGTDDRYSAGGNVSFFKGDRRVSLVGLFNNINQQNFS